jgi:hypothetical protein
VLASVPLAFALDLDPGAVDQQVQRALRPPIRDVDGQGLLPATECAEVGHAPVQTDQPKQALHEPRGLPQRHAEQHFHRQAALDGRVAVALAPPALARWRALPPHGRVEPDRQRAAPLQRLVVARPVRRLVCRRRGSAHAARLSRWIREVNPSSSRLCATKPPPGSRRSRALCLHAKNRRSRNRRRGGCSIRRHSVRRLAASLFPPDPCGGAF